ncbi:MAG: hypothetical protein M3Y86_05660 [Verrucomicrobiota bacterium]|nr:hypothetical protein [Verrucomicrobiota bacterium]
MKKIAAALALVLVSLGYHFLTAPIVHAPGVLVATEPEQIALPENTAPIEHGAFHLQPLARFSIDARLLHRQRYRWDRQSGLAPIDLALGWGAMSDQAVLDRMKISQSMRFYWYEYQMPPPLAPEEIVGHSTNVHVIPVDDGIEKTCRSFRAGELIHLDGELGEASGPRIGTWRSSLRRDDTGDGACELLLVEHVARIAGERRPTPRRLVSR